ncbi:MAG: SDR family oxidoreductase [Proteobacteria bacterium]|nr:SDR family oxidoreductase [Pseudomonadota bacterium]
MAGVALVTGAAMRIGRAIAEDLARDGWSVAIHYNRSKDAADNLVDEIAANGGCAASFAADLSHEDDVAILIDRVNARLGPIACLVNNASVFERDEIESATRESWTQHFDVNLRAPFVLIQKFSEQVGAGATGNIINILDQRVLNLTAHFTSYTLSKSALWTLTQCAAMALAPRIRVNAVGPGPTLPSRRQSDDEFKRQAESTPLMRTVGVDEISRAVTFILESPSLTGQMIALDSGQHLGCVKMPADSNE